MFSPVRELVGFTRDRYLSQDQWGGRVERIMTIRSSGPHSLFLLGIYFVRNIFIVFAKLAKFA